MDPTQSDDPPAPRVAAHARRRTGGGKVLIVFHETILGGATLSVLRALPELERRGWDPVFWAPDPSPLLDRLRADGRHAEGAPRTVSYSAAALRLPPGPRARLRAMPEYFTALRRFARECDAELAHVNSLVTLAEGAVLRAGGLPVVAHVHEMIAPTPKGALARAAIRAVSPEAIGVSGACAARLAIGDWHPHVVNEGAVYPAAPAARHRGAGEPPVVASVGVISRRKGSDVFVEAAEIVRQARPDFRFRLIGSATDPLDAGWAAGVLRRARAAGIEHAASADVPALLREIDVFALPSRIDPCPISLLEAMGAGLPVVGAASDGIPEQLDGGAAGELVPRENPAALAAAIVRLADEPERARALGASARARALGHYSIERQAAGIDRVWRLALER